MQTMIDSRCALLAAQIELAAVQAREGTAAVPWRELSSLDKSVLAQRLAPVPVLETLSNLVGVDRYSVEFDLELARLFEANTPPA